MSLTIYFLFLFILITNVNIWLKKKKNENPTNFWFHIEIVALKFFPSLILFVVLSIFFQVPLKIGNKASILPYFFLSLYQNNWNLFIYLYINGYTHRILGLLVNKVLIKLECTKEEIISQKIYTRNKYKRIYFSFKDFMQFFCCWLTKFPGTVAHI